MCITLHYTLHSRKGWEPQSNPMKGSQRKEIIEIFYHVYDLASDSQQDPMCLLLYPAQ